MKAGKLILKIFAGFVVILLLIVVAISIYAWKASDIKPPFVSQDSFAGFHRRQIDSTTFIIGSDWIRKNKFGLYEMSVSGNAFDRGLKNGILSRELLIQQEKAFTDQIKSMVPSSFYLQFLKYVIGLMNRDLSDHVSLEYKKEIYGISLSASEEFNWIGKNYARQLNYHAAHDIGHALQNLMLVGCSSFGAWDSKTEDGALILGRNFDFWVGDEFAVNKIVEFVRPDHGHNFAFVTWGGFIGVVSGMNDKGLTVTINAAKSAIPTGAATPVSLVAREILQYAGNIQEAVAIAHSRKMFVSESFLIGSAADHTSVVIEKTPDTLAVYDPHSDQILCTNHYQSSLLNKQKLNQDQMANSASVYREKRMQELLKEYAPLTPDKVAAILRDRKGWKGKDIGLGNEKAINQLIAHHSVIFMPDSLRMWVSTSPWQLGEFVCYDLRKVFSMDGLKGNQEIADNLWNIAPDSFLQSKIYQQFLNFKKERILLNQGRGSDQIVQNLIRYNPEYYESYQLAGDFYAERKQKDKAIDYYQQALSKEIPTREIETRILNIMKQLKKSK